MGALPGARASRILRAHRRPRVEPQLRAGAVGGHDLARHQVRHADEARDEGRGRALVDRLRVRHLLDHAAVHHGDPVGHRQRLLLVVGHVDERDAHVALDPLQLNLELLAQLEVERAERLVEQQHGRAVHERACERDALLLAARELRGPAPGLGRQPDALELLGHAPLDLGLVDLLALEPERHVLLHRAVREERVALEHRVGRPLEGGPARHVLAVEQHAALRRLLEAGDHPQRGGLATARRAQHREELAARDVQVHRAHRREVAEALRDPLEPHTRVGVAARACGHGPPLALQAHAAAQLMAEAERTQVANCRKHSALIRRSGVRGRPSFSRFALLSIAKRADTVVHCG